MIKINRNFDGAKFAEKFTLLDDDFYVYKGFLYCESLPDLTDQDILDCVVSIKYSITPSSMNVRPVSGSVDVMVTGEPNTTATIYAYDLLSTPNENDEYEIALDENGQGSEPFSPPAPGRYAITGKDGELSNCVSIIEVI